MRRSIPILFLAFFLTSASNEKGRVYEGFNLKDFEKSLCYIPAGSFHFGSADQDVPYPEQAKSYVATVAAFYMSNHEVTNGEYLEFLSDLKNTDTAQFRKMLPDTLGWRTPFYYNEPYIEYYLRHPAYSNFPVVNISHEQASTYCEWITKKYATFGRREYQSAVFKLPTHDQWYYASMGGYDMSYFPWDGTSMQDENGEWRANFTAVEQYSIGRIELNVPTIYGTREDREYTLAVPDHYRNGDITCDVLSYHPNNYGLYNLAGNVEEFVREKGISKGGSWYDTGYYLLNSTQEIYDSTNSVSCERGFRICMEFE